MRPAPTTEAQRAWILDVLRGYALLGIFVAHVPGFAGWDALAPDARAAIGSALDPTLQLLRDGLVRGKFYSLFSLLFGFGFALQLTSAVRSGDDFVARFRRRQLGLLAIGAIHSAFWHGDILLTYAVLGLLMLPTRRWPARRLFGFALACLVARTAWSFVPWIVADLFGAIGAGAMGAGAGVDETVRSTTAGYASTRLPDMLATNARFLGIKWLYVLYEGRLLSILGLFALGAALGRWRVHARTAALRHMLVRVMAIGGGIGLAGNAVLVVSWRTVPVFPPSGPRAAEGVLMTIALPALAVAMAAAIALAWERGGRRWLAWLAPPGRMALTTYLTQTIVGIACFYGVGLGWRGAFSLADCIGFALVVFAAQAVLARLWLARFAFGPVEWLWRCATYGRWLRLRRTARPTPRDPDSALHADRARGTHAHEIA
jgi:uncharacterized protein